MSWDGDISKMGRLATNVARLSRVPAVASRAVSDDLADAIEAEFHVGVDPYGEAWVPLAEATLAKGRTPPPLTDTGAMRRSTQVRPMPSAGVSITIPHPAQCHQTGWHGPRGDGPPRPVLPGRKFPALWAVIIDEAIEAAVKGSSR